MLWYGAAWKDWALRDILGPETQRALIRKADEDLPRNLQKHFVLCKQALKAYPENLAFPVAKLTFPRKRSKPVHKIDENCKTVTTVCENLCGLNAKSNHKCF